MTTIPLSTSQRNEVIDLTPQVRAFVREESRGSSGIVVIHVPHTTAGITLNENADPDVKRDLLTHLSKVVPRDPAFRHSEGNSDAHIKGTLVNFSLTLIVEKGELMLGTWQGVQFLEFDGPREREVWMKFIKE
jgi:secondary thiamine-phosphate synthase enzyme